MCIVVVVAFGAGAAEGEKRPNRYIVVGSF